ncbi:hypothetical protein BpHYR1_039678 [Brachionus plicatilis]|uniref:Uncharacterized protein n=1 Tax=Brachionus plicatilis TaxID=10195 RepID=A0A3M7RC68_BRAPC|nr:hypothetical protein BpHYR1_039678 [Brachionus plicatilis]
MISPGRKGFSIFDFVWFVMDGVDFGPDWEKKNMKNGLTRLNDFIRFLILYYSSLLWYPIEFYFIT